MAAPDIAVQAQPDILAAAAAARLLTRLVDLQSTGTVPKVVLTGGGVGIALLEQLRATVARDAVDWSQVEFYWGDERFLPPATRSATRPRPGPRCWTTSRWIRPRCSRWARTPAAGRPGRRPRPPSTRELLAAQAQPEDHGPVPSFDVMLLGMGGEGHTASIFPHSPAVYETERSVVAVHGCPKPPPTRVSLTLPAIRRSAEVWIVATGSAKAAVVAMALGGAGEVAIPVAGAQGRRRTRWLLDLGGGGQAPARPDAPDRLTSSPMHVVVDGANVVGSRPDGWWHDRAGAARRLAGQLVAALAPDPEIWRPRWPARPVGGSGGAPGVGGEAARTPDLPSHPQLAVVSARPTATAPSPHWSRPGTRGRGRRRAGGHGRPSAAVQGACCPGADTVGWRAAGTPSRRLTRSWRRCSRLIPGGRRQRPGTGASPATSPTQPVRRQEARVVQHRRIRRLTPRNHHAGQRLAVGGEVVRAAGAELGRRLQCPAREPAPSAATRWGSLDRLLAGPTMERAQPKAVRAGHLCRARPRSRPGRLNRRPQRAWPARISPITAPTASSGTPTVPTTGASGRRRRRRPGREHAQVQRRHRDPGPGAGRRAPAVPPTTD